MICEEVLEQKIKKSSEQMTNLMSGKVFFDADSYRSVVTLKKEILDEMIGIRETQGFLSRPTCNALNKNSSISEKFNEWCDNNDTRKK